jgi:ERCC4-type nuclease
MSEFTIIVDQREKQPYKFHRYPVDTEVLTLQTGDYCIKNDGSKISDSTFEPDYAVERKSAPDFLGSITWERDRFEKELARADSFSKRMPVVVEKPWKHFEEERYHKNVNFNSIDATIECHPEMFYMDYFFNRDRTKAEQLTYEFLKLRWKKIKGI